MNAATTSQLIDITDGNLYDAILLGYLNVDGDSYDKETGRTFGLDNWDELSEAGRDAWRWVFGSPRVPAWQRGKEAHQRIHRLEGAILARQGM